MAGATAPSSEPIRRSIRYNQKQENSLSDLDQSRASWAAWFTPRSLPKVSNKALTESLNGDSFSTGDHARPASAALRDHQRLPERRRRLRRHWRRSDQYRWQHRRTSAAGRPQRFLRPSAVSTSTSASCAISRFDERVSHAVLGEAFNLSTTPISVGERHGFQLYRSRHRRLHRGAGGQHDAVWCRARRSWRRRRRRRPTVLYGARQLQLSAKITF